MTPPAPAIPALLVDDDFIGAELTAAILRRVDPRLAVQIVNEPEQALHLLRVATHDRPRVVFLDLNMPRLDGHEVLLQIRGDPALADMRVIIVTNSDRPSDVAESMRLGADAHLAKPVAVEQLIERIKGISHLWQPTAHPS